MGYVYRFLGPYGIRTPHASVQILKNSFPSFQSISKLTTEIGKVYCRYFFSDLNLLRFSNAVEEADR